MNPQKTDPLLNGRFRERIKVCRRDAGPGNCGGLDVIRV